MSLRDISIYTKEQLDNIILIDIKLNESFLKAKFKEEKEKLEKRYFVKVDKLLI